MWRTPKFRLPAFEWDSEPRRWRRRLLALAAMQYAARCHTPQLIPVLIIVIIFFRFGSAFGKRKYEQRLLGSISKESTIRYHALYQH